MLTKIERQEIPQYRPNRSPLREFADATAREFVASSNVGDVCEVTGAGSDDDKWAPRLAQMLRSSLFYMDRDRDMRDEVRVFTRCGTRLFMERLEPKEQREARRRAAWRRYDNGGN